MGQKMRLSRDLSLAVVFLFLTLVMPPGPAAEETRTEKHVSIKAQRDMSVQDMITWAGYTIDDAAVVPFLADFTRLNEHVKSLSRIRKGVVVKLPLGDLRKSRTGPAPEREKTALQSAARLRIADRQESDRLEKEFLAKNRSMLLRNIRSLSEALDQTVTIDAEGFKFFSVNEKSEISLDASLFPLITMNKGRILVLDYTGVLPVELKDLIEIAWPEYRVVINRGGLDLRRIAGLLLDAMGYSFSRDKKILAGGATRIEYRADFTVYPKKYDILESDLTVIGIIGPQERATPDDVLAWLRERGIHIFELSYADSNQYPERGVKARHFDPLMNSREFTESLIELLGYNALRGKKYSLSGRKEFRYDLQTDLSVPLGRRTKVVEFTELSEQEIRYAEKRGFDIICIQNWEEKRAITKKILSLLALDQGSSVMTHDSSITPKGVKYRLLSDGAFVHSINGPVFITEAGPDKDILRSLVDKDIMLITF